MRISLVFVWLKEHPGDSSENPDPLLKTISIYYSTSYDNFLFLIGVKVNEVSK